MFFRYENRRLCTNGVMGTGVVAKAQPDGYTIAIASPGMHAAQTSLYPKLRMTL